MITCVSPYRTTDHIARFDATYRDANEQYILIACSSIPASQQGLDDRLDWNYGVAAWCTITPQGMHHIIDGIWPFEKAELMATNPREYAWRAQLLFPQPWFTPRRWITPEAPEPEDDWPDDDDDANDA